MNVSVASSQAKQDLAEFVFARRWTFPPELRHPETVTKALEAVRQRWGDANGSLAEPERPVFIFSAGWRSGSTLVQRLVNSSREVTVWGEPLGDAAFIARLAYSLGFITKQWPPDAFFGGEASERDISNKWVANLTPGIGYLRAAHRAFFIEWFKTASQKDFGIDRWGVKEVRLTIDHARYLKWLFPQARFLFVFRNPHDAFRSWRGNRWRSPWPGYYSRSAIAFARHWRLLMDGYLTGASDVDGLLVKFEDLVSGRTSLSELADHIGVEKMEQSVLERKINAPSGTIEKPALSRVDRTLLSVICGPSMRKAGYA